MAENEIEISELELADELLKDMVFPVETATDTKAATLLQLKKWLGTALPVGFILPAVGKINDSRFTLLDGKTIAKNGAYREFCEKVVEQVQAGNWFACSQEEYDADLLAYGQCGRFVVENDYIRIPKLTRFIGATVTLSEIGKAFAQSLPQHTHTRGSMNITGGPIHINAYGPGNITSGAFKTVATGASHNDSGGTGVDISFNAANAWTGSTSGASDGTYKSGAKVQPDHVKFPYYMVIGSEGQREDIAVDFNKINEDLNRKADLNFKNVESNSISLSRISREVINCTTLIQQDINLELVDGTLTLKKGSKVYVPNGFESDGTTQKFNVVTIESDVSLNVDWGTNEKLILVVKSDGSSLIRTGLNRASSGTTAPSGTDYTIWYDINSNLMKEYWNGGHRYSASLPIAIVTALGDGTAKVSSIDQIFNGFGYIGSTFFYYPKLQGKTANGLNPDGTYKGTVFTTTNVVTRTFSSSDNGERYLGIYGSNLNITYNNYESNVYDIKTNQYINTNNDKEWADVCVLAICKMTKGVISNFRPKTTFQAVDRNDTSWLSEVGAPSDRYIDLTLGANNATYKAPASGYYYTRLIGTSGNYFYLRNRTASFIADGGTLGSKAMDASVRVKKGDEVYVVYNGTISTVEVFRFIYAEGEK